MMTAPYIDFLGVAGCGKSTLATHLITKHQYLTRKDLQTKVFGKTPSKRLNYLLQNAQTQRFAARHPSLQQHIAQAQTSSNVSPALQERVRNWVWTDLCLRQKGAASASTQLYLFDEGILQRVAGFYSTRTTPPTVDSLTPWFKTMVRPALTIYITVDLETSLARMQQRNSVPIHFQTHSAEQLRTAIAYQIQAADLLYSAALAQGWNCVKFDNMQPFESARQAELMALIPQDLQR